MKLEYVHSIQVAQRLLRKGNPIVDVKQNYNNAKFAVFYFEDTPKFREDLKEILDYIKMVRND